MTSGTKQQSFGEEHVNNPMCSLVHCPATLWMFVISRRDTSLVIFEMWWIWNLSFQDYPCYLALNFDDQSVPLPFQKGMFGKFVKFWLNLKCFQSTTSFSKDYCCPFGPEAFPTHFLEKHYILLGLNWQYFAYFFYSFRHAVRLSLSLSKSKP